MKILHVISSGGLYGAEAVILALCEEFARMGHESAIALFDNKHLPNRQLADAAEGRGIHVHLVPCQGQLDRSAVLRLKALLDSGNYDICHSHGFKSDVYVYLAGRKQHQALVATCHSWIDNDPRVKLYGIVDRLILRCYDQIVSVSDDVTHRLKESGVHVEKVSFISNGVDVNRFRNRKPSLRAELGLSEEHVLAGTVGRLSPEKGIDHLLRAVKALAADNQNLRLVIVGDGPDREKLQSLAVEMKINNSVRFLGRRSDVPEVLASLDIIVQPSLSEGLPMTLLEALASGCAVVATAVGTVPAVIENRKHGILVPPASPDHLARAIAMLASNAPLRSRLAAAGQERAIKEFSSERMAKAYNGVYRKALDGKRRELSTIA